MWGILSGLVRLWWRFFVSGQSLLGRPTDNATFLHAASQDMRGKPYEKLSPAIWQRLARRWLVLGVPLLFLELWVAARAVQVVSTDDPAWTRIDWLHVALRWWILAVLTGLGYGIYRAFNLLRYRHTTNEFVYPTWQAACTVLGLAYHRGDARRMVALPEGFEPSDRIDEPHEHHWALRLSGIGRLLDWWAWRRLARERAWAEEDAELELELAEAEDEPDVAPSAELAIREPAGQLAYADRVRDRIGSSELDDPDILEEPVRIALPPGKCGAAAMQKNLLTAVGGVLGMPDPKATWTLRGRHPFVELRPNRPPPPAVTFAGIKRHFEAAPMERPVIGLAAGNHVVHIDYANNSPHVLVSGGAGTGKSTLLKTILCQRMHHGAGLIVLDYKRVSHRWAHNLPGCVYAWRIEDLHDIAVRAGEWLEKRIDTVLPEGDDTESELAKFSTVDILVEEINSLTPQLQEYWSKIGTGPSPAVAAIRRVVNMGRELSMHVHVGAQRASANVFGANGGDIRESFATRLVAKWTKQTWAMLAGGVPWQRFPGGGRGIWASIEDDEAKIVRVPFLTNAQAREWAMSGVPCPDTSPGGDLSATIPSTPAGVSVPELVTLRTAVDPDRGFLPGPKISLDAIRKAAQLPTFPPSAGEAGAAKTYDLQALVAWKAARDGEIREMDQSWGLPSPRREGRIYRFNVLDPASGAVVCGYVGQTVRKLDVREMEHRFDKPWADLIVGFPVEIWFSDSCTPTELDAQEIHFIHTLKPLYNYKGQEGAAHAVPKWTQVEERHARDDAEGRTRWVPVDIYNTVS